MDGADQIRRCGGAPRASLPILHASNPKFSNRELLGIGIYPTNTNQTVHHRSNRENNARLSSHHQADSTNPPEPAIRKMRRDLITQFNKQSRKRCQKAPSKNVSVRKKSVERFQSLTQNLIEPMFRLEMLERRITGERQGYEAMKSNAGPKGWPEPRPFPQTGKDRALTANLRNGLGRRGLVAGARERDALRAVLGVIGDCYSAGL
jgi:hypothetical protein